MTDLDTRQPETASHSAVGADPATRASTAHSGRLPRVSEVHDADALPLGRYLDRELSWLQFNERVLQMAADPHVPLLERAKFLAIFANNLDEFFMVRVAGWKRRIATGLAYRAASGLEPRELLERIFAYTNDLVQEQCRIFRDEVRPQLAAEGIHMLRWEDLTETERDRLSVWFRDRVFPVLTPLAVDPAHPFPYISGLSLNLAVLLRHPHTGNEHFARVKVPTLLPRMVPLDDETGTDANATRFVPLEDVIASHLPRLFPGMEVLEHFTFRVTRNQDLEVEEDEAENLLTALERELTRRRFGPPVRLEVVDDMDDHVMHLITKEVGIRNSEVFRLPAPLDLTCLFAIADIDRADLRYERFVPTTHSAFGRDKSGTTHSVFSKIRDRDLLLHHPYHAFSTSVQAFIEHAADDPNVLAIKQTLYRTSGDSPIIDALVRAAEAGKQVLAVVEIKARFDEQANIDWARTLEQAGVHVVYGIVGLKTHSKLSLVVRLEGDTLRRYCHIGTGNYHPKTARFYEDYGLLTCDPHIGEDLTKLFNQLSGWAPSSTFKRLLVAPGSLRSGLLTRIEQEIQEAKAGRPAFVGFKLNSIVDEKLIDALYRASQAGVQVDILVRGICAIRPGIPGVCDTMRVTSVLGRFLEHSRVFIFGERGQRGVFIGSADMMHRNLDRRVEALVPISDPGHVASIVERFEKSMSDDVASWRLGFDGSWTRHHLDDAGSPLLDVQQWLIEATKKQQATKQR